MVVQDTGVWLAVLLLGINSMKFFLWVFLGVSNYEMKVLVDKWSMYKLHPVYFILFLGGFAS